VTVAYKQGANKKSATTEPGVRKESIA
jgi:hypothetical protein